jgi:hypothetical protein
MISFGAAEREPPLGQKRDYEQAKCDQQSDDESVLHTHLLPEWRRSRPLNASDHAIVAAVRLIGSDRSAEEYCGAHHIGDGNTLARYAKASGCLSL